MTISRPPIPTLSGTRLALGLARLALLLVSLALPLPSPASAAPASQPVALRSWTIAGADELAGIPPGLQAEAFDGTDRVVIVQLPGPVTPEAYQRLERRALEIYTYLPHHAYLVKLPAVLDAEAEAAALGARWVGAYHPAYKLSPAVSAVAPERGAAAEEPPIAPLIVMVQVFPDADLDATVERIEALGVGRVVGAARNLFFSRVRLLAEPARLARSREALARLPEVFWVDLEARRVLLNDTTIWVGQSGLSAGQTTPVFDHGLFGEGQIVGVLDTGVDPDMCYFRDDVRGLPPTNECDGGTVVDLDQRKVVAVDFLWPNDCAGGIGSGEWDDNDHGTHVAGTVLGDDLANPGTHDPGDGMAPAAKLVMQDCGFHIDDCADCPGIGCPVVDLNPVFQQAYTQGARLHTNSWGDQENNAVQNNYTAGSQDADEFMWNHKDFLLFFAAGNSGPGAESVGSPSTGKNVVSVGATLRGSNAGSMASFSSCGPTDDGRFKPDVTIPGAGIVSANSDNNTTSENCNTRTLSGTSMASPAAAGLTALIRQYYTEGWYPSGSPAAADAFTPSAALLKASLIGSAEIMISVPTPPPSNCQGWGRVLLDNVLAFDGDARRLWVEDDPVGFPLGAVGEERTFTLRVTTGAEPLRATLTWTDFPSTPAAAVHLVNDLDLEVTGPGGTFLGNVFAFGESLPGGSADRVNTVEQVRITAPPPGLYTVTVRAANVPAGPQPFALVVTGAVEEVSPGVFADGFESGDTSAWSETLGLGL